MSIAGGSIRGSGGVVVTGGATVVLRDINFEGLFVDARDAGTSATLTNVRIADSPSDGICARRCASVTAMQTDVKGSACFGVSVVDGAEFVAGDGSIVDSGNSGVFVSSRSSIACDGLRVSGNGKVQQHGSVLLQDAAGCIEGGSIVDNFGHGVSAQLGSTVTLDTVVVENNGIHAAGDGSVITLSDNCLLSSAVDGREQSRDTMLLKGDGGRSRANAMRECQDCCRRRVRRPFHHAQRLTLKCPRCCSSWRRKRRA